MEGNHAIVRGQIAHGVAPRARQVEHDARSGEGAAQMRIQAPKMVDLPTQITCPPYRLSPEIVVLNTLGSCPFRLVHARDQNDVVRWIGWWWHRGDEFERRALHARALTDHP